MKKLIFFLDVLVLVTVIFTLSPAQSSKKLPSEPTLLFDHPGTFKVVNWSVYGMSDKQYSSAEKDLNSKKLQSIISVLRTTPVLQSPRGFDCQVLLYGRFTDPFLGYGIPCNLSVQFCGWYDYNGKVGTACIEPPRWEVQINDIKAVGGTNSLGYTTPKPREDVKAGFDYEKWKSVGQQLSELVTMPGVKETLAPGLDRYGGLRIVVYNPTRPPYWLPVNLEEVFTLKLAFWRLHPDEIQSQFAVKLLEEEYARFTAEERKLPAFQIDARAPFAGVGTDSTQMPVLRINKAYWNMHLPRTSVQFMTFNCQADIRLLQREELELRSVHGSSVFGNILEQQLSLTSFIPLIDR